jgi:hypothetical protein
MKRSLLITAVILCSASAQLSAGGLPTEFTYIIYIRGQDAGRSTTKVTEKAETYVLESRTELEIEHFRLELDTRTEIDRTSYLPIKFTYSGSNSQQALEGETTIVGNEATCDVLSGGERFTSSLVSKHPVLLLEEYVMAHEVVIARAFWESGEDPVEYGLLFPSTTNMTTVSISRGSELMFESDTKEAYCVKFIVSLSGGAPFASYFDPERGLPVYLAFPGSNTEVFLDEFFDGKPLSRYRE